MHDANLKQCTVCKVWLSAEDIIKDPDIVPLGMSLAVDNPEKAYYYFIHNVPDCGTTFLIPVEDLAEFVAEAIPTERLTLTDHCEDHCVSIDDLSECHQECYYAPYRRLLLTMFEAKRLAAAQAQQ